MSRHAVAMHVAWMHADVLSLWQEYRGPLAAFAAALVLAILGRYLRIGVAAAAAGGAGVVVGWYAITGSVWVMSPLVSVNDLGMLAAIVLVIGLLCAKADPALGTPAGTLLAALLAGWLLSGRPLHWPALVSRWPLELGIVLVMVLGVRGLSGRGLTPLPLVVTALALAEALHIVETPPVWTQLALVPAAAALPMLVLPPLPGLVALPVAADIAAVAALAVISYGRLPHLGVGQVDVAALSPLLMPWLAPRLATKISIGTRAQEMIAWLLAGTLTIGLAWTAHRALGR